MLTTEPTIEMLEQWKQIYNKYRNTLRPNRKTGAEINDYFLKKYNPEKVNSTKFINVVKDNILMNEYNRDKLPLGTKPQVVTYILNDVYVGIDLVTGFIHVECEVIDKAARIYDDLFVFRGLDEKDLTNYFLVAQYIELTQHQKE